MINNTHFCLTKASLPTPFDWNTYLSNFQSLICSGKWRSQLRAWAVVCLHPLPLDISQLLLSLDLRYFSAIINTPFMRFWQIYEAHSWFSMAKLVLSCNSKSGKENNRKSMRTVLCSLVQSHPISFPSMGISTV